MCEPVQGDVKYKVHYSILEGDEAGYPPNHPKFKSSRKSCLYKIARSQNKVCTLMHGYILWTYKMIYSVEPDSMSMSDNMIVAMPVGCQTNVVRVYILRYSGCIITSAVQYLHVINLEGIIRLEGYVQVFALSQGSIVFY